MPWSVAQRKLTVGAKASRYSGSNSHRRDLRQGLSVNDQTFLVRKVSFVWYRLHGIARRGLEKQLRSSHRLLFQSTQVRFPAPTWQLTVASNSRPSCILRDFPEHYLLCEV